MFDCCLPMKIMKLVMKKPIQTHVIIGTFWGVENLTLRSSQMQPVKGKGFKKKKKKEKM